ncbi:MAG: 50S ribosomal protein L6 [Elusimicrobia bacterium]|nr:50S ribosomal protein L6 [Elusimicrobiota bacterium]
MEKFSATSGKKDFMNATIATEPKKEAPLSRLGRKPVEIPQGVKVSVSAQTIQAEGTRGKLSWVMPNLITAKVEGSQVKIMPTINTNQTKALHGLSRKLILNMVEGVTKGFQKRLMVEGVGFRSAVAGNKLTLTLGFSHPVVFEIPVGIKILIDPKAPNLLVIEGNDKQMVGQVAAQIRAIKKPEPYKGTGIRYENEVVKRKAGKAAAGAAGAGAGGGGKK